MHCYHHTDMDGYAAGFIVSKICDANNIPYDFNTDFTPTNYDMPLNRHKRGEDIIFVVDLSFTKDTIHLLTKCCEDAKKVFWIDHHKSSYDLISDEKFYDYNQYWSNLYIYFSMDGCGALNANRLLLDFSNDFKNKLHNSDQSYITYLGEMSPDTYAKVPRWLLIIDDHDRWIKALPETNNFISGTGIENIHLTVSVGKGYKKHRKLNPFWRNMHDSMIEYYVEKGETINKYLTARYSSELKHAFEVEVLDIKKDLSGINKTYKVLCKNGHHNSMNFLDKIHEYDAVSIFYFNGSRWVHSVYCDKEVSEFDCAKFCEQFDGGGHKGAAGFSTSAKEGPLWLQKKTFIY